MRQVARRLDREDEARRRLLHPARDRRAARQPVERRVHLDRVEELRVVLEPLRRRQPRRIEDAFAPVRVVPAAAAYADRALITCRHTSSVPAAATRERGMRSSGASTNCRVAVDVRDREPALAHEQLPGGDVDRAVRLQRADGVEAAGGEVAERERERAHDPEAVRDAVERRRLAPRPRGQRRLEREQLDPVLRTLRRRAARRSGTRRRRGAPSTPRRSRSRRRSANSTSLHRLAVGDRDREREERDAALRVERAVDRVDDDARASAAELADLLGDDRRVDPVEAREDRRARPPRRSPSCRRRPRPATSTGSRSARVGSSASSAAHVLRRAAAEREPVSQAG